MGTPERVAPSSRQVGAVLELESCWMDVELRELTGADLELIEFARRIAEDQSDGLVHTVGAAVRGFPDNAKAEVFDWLEANPTDRVIVIESLTE